MNTYIVPPPSNNPYFQSAVPPQPSLATDALAKTHSIDAVIDRVHLVASNINEMTHVVVSREKSSSIPLVLLYIGLICGTIAIFLAVLQFAAMGFHKLFHTYKYRSAVRSEETNTAAADGVKTSKHQQDPTNLRLEEI